MPIDYHAIEREIQSGNIFNASIETLWSYRQELDRITNASGGQAFQKLRETLHQTVCDLIKRKEAQESERRSTESERQRHDEITSLNKKAITVSEEAVKVSESANDISKAANIISLKSNEIANTASCYSKIALYVAIAALVISGLQFYLDWRNKLPTENQLAIPEQQRPETKSNTPPLNTFPLSILTNAIPLTNTPPKK